MLGVKARVPEFLFGILPLYGRETMRNLTLSFVVAEPLAFLLQVRPSPDGHSILGVSLVRVISLPEFTSPHHSFRQAALQPLRHNQRLRQAHRALCLQSLHPLCSLRLLHTLRPSPPLWTLQPLRALRGASRRAQGSGALTWPWFTQHKGLKMNLRGWKLTGSTLDRSFPGQPCLHQALLLLCLSGEPSQAPAAFLGTS